MSSSDLGQQGHDVVTESFDESDRVVVPDQG
jgi:hypothetical protein